MWERCREWQVIDGENINKTLCETRWCIRENALATI